MFSCGCGGADGHVNRHMKHKDSEEMLSGPTLLEMCAHIHTVMKGNKKSKEVEDELRILQQLSENEEEERD